MNIQLKTVFGDLIFEGDFACIADAVKAALAAKKSLSYANLRSANLSSADLSCADLRSAENLEYAIAVTRILPDGNIVGWKKGRDGAIVRLLVPTEAKRSSAFGRKCRAEFVRVLEIFRDNKPSAEPAFATYDDGKTKYEIGQITRCDKWCEDFTQECAGGIHFFITRLEAENYQTWAPT